MQFHNCPGVKKMGSGSNPLKIPLPLWDNTVAVKKTGVPDLQV
jgi:hypothetical protein